MHKHCNSLNCLSIVITVLNNRVNIESNANDSLNIRVSKGKNLFISGCKANESMRILPYILNKKLNVNCSIICTTNDNIDNRYIYLVCKSGIVHTKDNKPIYILK